MSIGFQGFVQVLALVFVSALILTLVGTLQKKHFGWLTALVFGVFSFVVIYYAFKLEYPDTEQSAGANFAYNLIFMPMVSVSCIAGLIASVGSVLFLRLSKGDKLRYRILMMVPLTVLLLPTFLEVSFIILVLLYVFAILFFGTIVAIFREITGL